MIWLSALLALAAVVVLLLALDRKILRPHANLAVGLALFVLAYAAQEIVQHGPRLILR